MTALNTFARLAAAVVIAVPTFASADVFPSGYFKLTTQFREGANECLEGNQVAGSMDGAAFMDSCQDVTGQLWKAIDAGGGYFRLTTMFREGEGECLEGNQVGGSMGGAAFMDSCQNVTGQLWRIR